MPKKVQPKEAGNSVEITQSSDAIIRATGEVLTQNETLLNLLYVAFRSIQSNGKDAYLLIRDDGSHALGTLEAVPENVHEIGIAVKVPEFNGIPSEIIRAKYTGIGHQRKHLKRRIDEALKQRELLKKFTAIEILPEKGQESGVSVQQVIPGLV